MTLKLYNTLTRRLEEFKPLVAGKVNALSNSGGDLQNPRVKMYYCGVTVYDYCHLGHARACIVWDVVRRYLQFLGYQVRYVQNFTDIDDKILNRARQENSSMQEVAERYIQAYFTDMARLNIKEADEYPRATHTIDGIKRLIHELEQKDYAYASEGDVYYKVRSFAEYGKLSGRRLEDSQAGASGRVEDLEASKKQDPFDFALWKGANPGEPSWESPWGAGRPGWHIECSAMVRDRLGETIDIHAGGADLIFPHHENEIAQSEAVTGKPLARYWMHNGMVTVDDEKMSKSLGNFITIRELLDRPTDPMAVRLFVLMAHYRKPIDFSDRALESAQNGWETLKEGLLFGARYGEQLGWSSNGATDSEAIERFQAAVNEDFNFSSGLSVLFEIAKELGKEANNLVHQGKTQIPSQQLETMWHTLVKLADVLGLEAQLEAQTPVSDGLSDAQIEELVQMRSQARIAKNFAESDRIRNELQAQGITIIDNPQGSRWHR